MAENTFKTRIALLYKTIEEWGSIQDTFIPLRGEICICDASVESNSQLSKNSIAIKVGDGTHTFGNLQWLSATSSDVYSWAKKENLDFDDLDTEFLNKLYSKILQNSTSYRVYNSSTGVWKLQKKLSDSQGWEDQDSIDVKSLLDDKVDKNNLQEIISNDSDNILSVVDDKLKVSEYESINSDSITNLFEEDKNKNG